MTDPPRVLMVIAFLDHRGGVQRQATRLARALAARGVVVEFLTASPRARGAAEGEAMGGVRVCRLPFAHGVPLGTLKFRFLNRRLSRWMRAHAGEYDIVHVHQALWPAYAAARTAQEAGKPCLVKVGNTGERFDLRVLRRSRWGGRAMAEFCREHVTRFVATSRRMEAELRAFGVRAGRIVRIPNGVALPPGGPRPDEAARRAVGAPAEGPLFLHVGALARHKRPLLALEAFATAARTHPGARLWFLGEGPLEGRIKRAIRRSGWGGRIRCCGSVADVSPYLRAADGFVSASVAEGMSNALLEAMAHGLACVATRISGAEDLIRDGENGRLVPPDDLSALAGALEPLLGDGDLRRRLGAAARRTIREGYRIESVAERYLDLYRRVT